MSDDMAAECQIGIICQDNLANLIDLASNARGRAVGRLLVHRVVRQVAGAQIQAIEHQARGGQRRDLRGVAGPRSLHHVHPHEIDRAGADQRFKPDRGACGRPRISDCDRSPGNRGRAEPVGFRFLRAAREALATADWRRYKNSLVFNPEARTGTRKLRSARAKEERKR